MPFAARGGFLYQEATVPPTPGSFGNSAFWSSSADTNYYLSTTSTTGLLDWQATTGFTVEFWIYVNQWPGTINPGPGNHDNSGTNYWSFGPANDGILEFYFWNPGQTYLRTNTGALSLDTWHNVAIVFTNDGAGNTTGTMYIDGVRQQINYQNGSFANSQTFTGGVFSTGTPFELGGYSSNFWDDFYMDNLRVSNVNRYSGASYTVATAPFTTDADTQLLLICDGANGSTTFTDSSGFARTITNNSNNVVISDARANHS